MGAGQGEDRDHRGRGDRLRGGRPARAGRPRRDAGRPVARARGADQERGPPALRAAAASTWSRHRPPPPRARDGARAVRGGLRGGEVLRHRVGHPARGGPPAAARRRGRRLPERHQRPPGGRGGRARAHPRLRHPDQRRHVRAGPRHPHRPGQRRVQDRRARRQRLAARAADRRDHERGGARGGDHEPVGRALVEARAQLHAEPARGPERPRHRRGALGAADPAAGRPPGGRGGPGRHRARPPHRAHPGHRGPALRGRHRRAAIEMLGKEIAADASSRSGGRRRCCRT